MNPFHSHPDDILWKFKIKDWFDAADSVACDILMLLVADKDIVKLSQEGIGTQKSKIGEFIINSTENDLHSIVAYQVLEGIAGVDLLEDTILK